MNSQQSEGGKIYDKIEYVGGTTTHARWDVCGAAIQLSTSRNTTIIEKKNESRNVFSLNLLHSSESLGAFSRV